MMSQSNLQKKQRRPNPAQKIYMVSQEDFAALTLLKNAGLPVLDAAHIACTAIRMSKADLTRCIRVIEAGVKALELQERTETFETVAWASVAARSGRRATTRRDLRHYVRRMLKVEGVADMPLRAMTTAQCRHILQVAFGHSLHVYRKGRAILHSIFTYGFRQELCDSNPVSRIETPEVPEKPIHPLSTEEVERLCNTVESRSFRDMRFSLSLLLFSGVRPTEVDRITQDDVCWEERQVIIRSQKSKTGGGRVVPLRLLPGIRRQDCQVPQNWQRRWQALRRTAGFTHWRPDVCRHTFASYYAAYFRNLPELQLEMGHRDLSLLRTRYMMPVSHREAVKFWKNMYPSSPNRSGRFRKGRFL